MNKINFDLNTDQIDNVIHIDNKTEKEINLENFDKLVFKLSREAWAGDIDLRYNNDIHLVWNAVLYATKTEDESDEIYYLERDFSNLITRVNQFNSQDALISKILEYLHLQGWNSSLDPQNKEYIGKILFRIRETVSRIKWIEITNVKPRTVLVDREGKRFSVIRIEENDTYTITQSPEILIYNKGNEETLTRQQLLERFIQIEESNSFNLAKEAITKAREQIEYKLKELKQQLGGALKNINNGIKSKNYSNLRSHLTTFYAGFRQISELAKQPENSALLYPEARTENGKPVDLPYSILREFFDVNIKEIKKLFKDNIKLFNEGNTTFIFSVLDGLANVGKGTIGTSLGIVSKVLNEDTNDDLGLQTIKDLHFNNVSRDLLEGQTGTGAMFAPKKVTEGRDPEELDRYQTTYPFIAEIVSGTVSNGIWVDDTTTLGLVLLETLVAAAEAKAVGKEVNGITWDVFPRSGKQYELMKELVDELSDNETTFKLETELVLGLNSSQVKEIDKDRESAAKASGVVASGLKSLTKSLNEDSENDNLLNGLMSAINYKGEPDDIESLKNGIRTNRIQVNRWAEATAEIIMVSLRESIVSNDYGQDVDKFIGYFIEEVGECYRRALLRFANNPAGRQDDAFSSKIINRFRSHFDGRTSYISSIDKISAGGEEPGKAIEATIISRLGNQYDENDKNQSKYLKVAAIINQAVVDRVPQKEITIEFINKKLNEQAA